DDLELTTCISPNDLQPDDLDAPFNEPIVSGASTCNDISVTFQDLPIISEGNNCVVIRRVWTVTENCVFDPNNPDDGGQTEHTQRIIINETEPPVITCPPRIVVVAGNDCMENVFIDGIDITGECLPNDVSLRVSGDLGSGRFFVYVTVGDYYMNAEAKDRWGNKNDCDFVVRVIDDVDPVANCLPQFIANIGVDETVTVFGQNLNDNSSDNCTTDANLEFRIGPVPPQGTTTPPSNVPLTFICDDVSSTAPVALWVGDESGNWAFCTTTLQIEDPQSNCAAGTATAIVAGTIQAMNGSMVDQVDITLEGMNMPTIRTDINGQFQFSGLEKDASYRLSAKRETSYREGLSTADIIQLAQHITKRKPLTDPYRQIAADVNGDNRISTLDIITLQKLIINRQDVVPTNESWRFVPKDFVFPDPTDIFDNGFPEFKDIRGLKEDYWSADFVAIKVGDVNQSFYPDKSQNQLLENRSGASLNLTLSDKSFAAGETFTVDISNASEEQVLLSIQTALEIHSDLEVLEIYSNQFDQNLQYHQDIAGGFLLSAFTNGVSTDKSTLLSLRLKAHRTGQLKDLINIQTNTFQSEAVLASGQIINQLNLSFVPDAELSMYLVPNPFTEKAQLNITSAQQESIHYQIWNSNGQLITQNSWEKQAGTAIFDIHSHQLDGPGLYYLKVISPSGTQVLKIVKQ
ncbi:MAG: T9SS type A sorting domain-containing protein, partial [Bacteroidota bacterium]